MKAKFQILRDKPKDHGTTIQIMMGSGEILYFTRLSTVQILLGMDEASKNGIG